MMDRSAKFRQAAIAYLHVGVLYEGAAYVMWHRGVLVGRGPVWIQHHVPGWAWLVVGGAVMALIVWGLWTWHNVWFARAVWLLNVLRVPSLIGGAFFPLSANVAPQAFYATALVVVVINLWMLARAAWDV